ncbi:TPA: response regulator [Clostridium botulinum]|nr:response regulator [Clostridium botulinum]
MKKALIVDDAKFMRMIVRNAIKKMNIEVVGEAENGIQAIEAYKKLKPDFVTMDITMNEMNGIEAVREIIAFDPNAKIIMCSAMGQQSLLSDAIKAGAKDFIVKPFKEGTVQDAVNKLFI